MALLSGVITVTTAGTAVQGPDSLPGTYVIRPDPANVGQFVYVGNDGEDDVSATTGLKMGYGSLATIVTPNLNLYYFDADVDGDKLTWVRESEARTNAKRILAILAEDRELAILYEDRILAVNE